jgi:hypothetical protein
MEDWQQRVVDEKKELDKKLENLRKFLSTESFQKLAIKEQARLEYQKLIMMSYSDVLHLRIVNFAH